MKKYTDDLYKIQKGYMSEVNKLLMSLDEDTLQIFDSLSAKGHIFKKGSFEMCDGKVNAWAQKGKSKKSLILETQDRKYIAQVASFLTCTSFELFDIEYTYTFNEPVKESATRLLYKLEKDKENHISEFDLQMYNINEFLNNYKLIKGFIFELEALQLCLSEKGLKIEYKEN